MVIRNILFFSNGNTAAFNKNGEQIPELQYPWIKLYFDFLKSKGIEDIHFIQFELPNGRKAKYLPEYDNWEIV